MSRSRGLRELDAAVACGATWDELGAMVSRALHRAVPHDALRLTGVGPGCGLSSFSFWHGYETDFGQALLRSCHIGEDPYRWEDLLPRAVPAALVGAGPAGDRRHRATRRLFADHGVGSELRLVLRDTRHVWGTLGLLRTQGGTQFGTHDIATAARLTPALVAFLRQYVTAGTLSPLEPNPPPGVLVVGADHQIRQATPQAIEWRRCLSSRQSAPAWTGKTFFAGLSAAAARSPAAPTLVVGPSASYGRWVACQAELLGEGPGADVAVVIQAATANQLLPSLCFWYGITPRERQVVEHLCDAAAPKQIARLLELSVHTVNDHLRSVFRKTGLHGSQELVAALRG
ncbi:helix-turn-helix transcriptional regulator [Amycolatopsis magusensis]|uniref:helix-turn-helix transcriptional regulator n=1 Tax=Amycolatopsis magusensis TaxID=882444 RepID=UPI0024A7FF4E|nr:helix-turn-helix transcriptional regulator [Amycolatopsis magusensis]MDI5976128.1 helix-turn-helix transcriptional regulator [Amycolatopsis magusensis]